MQKKKETKPVKQIILLIIAVILLLLLIFAEDIIKLTNKNKLNIAENTENELISNESNVPQLSAGMIPVKWDGTNWIITTAKDKDWYDYSKGKPAYIMLNDGKYQSELIKDMTNKELAENNVGVGVPDDPNIRGSIYIWISRFAYKETGETCYIKEETTPGEEWIVSDLFAYKISDETKPDFSLSGVWVAKDIDSSYANKITQMNQEESVYGFIANTKPKRISSTDIIDLQKFVGVGLPDDPFGDITNLNRIMLQIVNTSKYEPIKANITQNIAEGRLEIRVTYSANGIREILDEYGTPMILTEEDGIIYTDTVNLKIAKGTYSFTVIDNKGNKKLLSITPNIDSLYKVAYVNGTDNMDNAATYTKTQETRTAEENALINQLETNTSVRFYKVITDSNNAITAIDGVTRTSEDEQLYVWGRYKANLETKYVWKEEPVTSSTYRKTGTSYYYYKTMTKSSNGASAILKDVGIKYGSDYGGISKCYTAVSGFPSSFSDSSRTVTTYYYWDSYNSYNDNTYVSTGTKYTSTKVTEYSRGDFISNIIAKDGAYTIGSATSVHSDGYWYEKGILAPKYTLYKYDQNLTLQSTYDVDSKVLTTVPIDISNKGNNKVKLALKTTGTDYKTYISSDNTNWQEVTDITSNTPKELSVDGWDNLYIKIETNTSRINNIDVAFYKD